MFDEAKARLRRLEASHGIRILYACEAGSRSWGFPSPSSDYDIRFIYVRPLKNYLKLTPPADTITLDQDGVWDISGWDLKKCLMLLKKGNVSIVQSLYSQIVYRNHPLFLAEMRKLLDYGAPLPRLYWAYRSKRSAGALEETGPKTLFPGVLSFIETALAQTQPPAGQAIDINEEVLDDFYLKWLGVPGLSHPGA